MCSRLCSTANCLLQVIVSHNLDYCPQGDFAGRHSVWCLPLVRSAIFLACGAAKKHRAFYVRSAHSYTIFHEVLVTCWDFGGLC